MNHELLKAEIAKPEYDKLAPADIITTLRAKTATNPQAVSIQRAVRDLVIAGAYDKATALAQMERDLFSSIRPEAAVLDALVTAGHLDVATRAAIDNTGTVPFLSAIDCPELLAMDDSSAIDHTRLARGEDPQDAKKAAAAAIDTANGLLRDASGRAIIPAGMMLDTDAGKLVAQP